MTYVKRENFEHRKCSLARRVHFRLNNRYEKSNNR